MMDTKKKQKQQNKIKKKQLIEDEVYLYIEIHLNTLLLLICQMYPTSLTFAELLF